MEIEHIVWQDYYGGDVYGIIDLEIIWHGGDKDRVVMQGHFIDDGRGEFNNHVCNLSIDENTTGVAAVRPIRVGKIV